MVERCVRDAEAASSSLVTSTIKKRYQMKGISFFVINKTLTKHNINDIIMLRSPMPKTTYLNQNALGYSAEGVFVLV